MQFFLLLCFFLGVTASCIQDDDFTPTRFPTPSPKSKGKAKDLSKGKDNDPKAMKGKAKDTSRDIFWFEDKVPTLNGTDSSAPSSTPSGSSFGPTHAPTFPDPCRFTIFITPFTH